MSARRSIGLCTVLLLVCGTASRADESPVASWQTGSPVGPACAACGPSALAVSDCGSCSTPTFQFTADLLILSRSGPDAAGLFYDADTGAELLNAEDLVPPAEAGVRLGMIFFDECGYDIEWSYLGTDRFVAERTRSSETAVTFPFFGGFPVDPSDTYSVSYASRLRSGELNLRHRWTERIALLAGLRVVELKERFDITDGNGGFFSSTDNDLYGGQFGGDLMLLTILRSQLFTTLKAGVYYNNADVMAEASGAGGQLIQFIDDEDELALVGDVVVGMLIPMGPRADLRIGYQGIFLDGVGVAPDQSDDFSLFTASGSLDESTVFFHGGFLGVDLFF